VSTGVSSGVILTVQGQLAPRKAERFGVMAVADVTVVDVPDSVIVGPSAVHGDGATLKECLSKIRPALGSEPGGGPVLGFMSGPSK